MDVGQQRTAGDRGRRGAVRRDPDHRRHWRSSRICSVSSGRGVPSCWPPVASAGSWPRTTGRLDFLDETREIREDTVVAGCAGRRPRRPPGRDHRPDRAEDAGQRAQLRREGVHGRLRGRQSTPTWHNKVQGQINLIDAIERRIDFVTPEGKELRAQRDGRGADAAAARLAPAGEARPRRRRADQRRAVRLRDVLLPQRASGCSSKGTRPYFYLPKMESHLEARLWNDVFVHAQEALGVPTRDDPRHRADRDDPGGVRDGRDPLRAAGALLRPQRRSVGLHVLDDQDVPGPRRGVPAAGSQQRDHDRAVHARLHRAAGADLPQARRVRDGRDGGVHPESQGCRGQPGRAGEGQGRQGARGGGGLRRHLGGAPRPGRDRDGGVRRGARRPPEPDRQAAARGRRHAPTTCWPRTRRRGRRPASGCAPTSTSASATSSRGCAATVRRRSTT